MGNTLVTTVLDDLQFLSGVMKSQLITSLPNTPQGTHVSLLVSVQISSNQ